MQIQWKDEKLTACFSENPREGATLVSEDGMVIRVRGGSFGEEGMGGFISLEVLDSKAEIGYDFSMRICGHVSLDRFLDSVVERIQTYRTTKAQIKEDAPRVLDNLKQLLDGMRDLAEHTDN